MRRTRLPLSRPCMVHAASLSGAYVLQDRPAGLMSPIGPSPSPLPADIMILAALHFRWLRQDMAYVAIACQAARRTAGRSHVGMKLVEAIVKEGDEMLYRIAY